MIAALVLAVHAAFQTPDGETFTSRAAAAMASLDAEDLGALWSELNSAEGELDSDARAAREMLDEFRMELLNETYKLSVGERLPRLLAGVELFDAVEFPAWVIYFHDEIANVYRVLERYDAASRHLREGIEVLEGTPWDDATRKGEMKARLSCGLCNAYREQGLIDLAAEQLPVLEAEIERQLRLPEGEREAFQLGRMLCARAKIDESYQRWDHVREWVEDAFDKGHFGPWEDQARLHLGKAYLATAAGDSAYVQKAEDYIRVVAEDPRSDEILRAQASKYMSIITALRGDYEEAHSHLEELSRLRSGGAFVPLQACEAAIVELSLALTEDRDAEQVARAGQQLLESWRVFLQGWKRRVPREGGTGFLTGMNQQRVLAAVLQYLATTEGVDAAYAELLEVQSAGTLFKRLADADTADPRALPQLRAKEALLVYQPSPEGICLFLQHEGGVEFRWIDVPRSAYLRESRALVRLVRQSPLSPSVPRGRRRGIEELGGRLWRVLVPEDCAELVTNAERVTVVGIEVLERLPFEVLRPDGGPPLGLTHDVGYLPAAPLRALMRTDRRDTELAYCILAGGAGLDFEPGFDEGLRASYGAVESRTHLGQAATVAELRAATRSGVSVFQLLAHGVWDPAREVGAAVELADALLGYAEVRELERAPRLAMLTACGAWRGPRRPGDGGVGHLAGAFLERGSLSVVLPAADVEVAATLAWSEVFHWALARGMSPSCAAREARLALEESERWADPYYHSLLHVVGHSHVPIFDPPIQAGGVPPIPRRDPRWPWGCAAAGVVIGLLDVRRRSMSAA